MDFLNSELLMTLFGIFVAILVLSILIAVHEAGHLLMAKWSNIRVDTFSIGMGKPIWGFQYGETYYQIGRLPFGGYCGFGEEENGDKDDLDPRALTNSPLWARLLTVIGGSLFNIIFAYVMIVILSGVGFQEEQLSNKISVPKMIQIAEKGNILSPAWKAGLRSGDTIIKIGNKEITHFMEIPLEISYGSTDNKIITYIHENKTNTTSILSIPDKDTGLDIIGISPVQPAIISEVLSNTPAQKSKLQIKDQIIAINGEKISYFYQVVEKVQLGHPLILSILRNEKEYQVNIIPQKINDSWQIGIKGEYPQKITVIKKSKNILEAFDMGGKYISRLISQMGTSLIKLFTGKVNVQKNLSGPVRIISITGDIAQTMDFSLIIRFMVMLSIALAIFNLLPFPGLDGGAIILQTARAIFKDNEKAEKIIGFIEQIGIILLLTLAAFVFINDILNLIP